MKGMLAVMAIGGLAGLPFYKDIAELIRKKYGKDIESGARELLSSPFMRDLISYGLPSALGVDISGSLSIRFPDMEREGIGSIIGVPYDALYADPVRALRAIDAGRWDRATEEVAPTAIKNIMVAHRLYKEGQYSISGKPINVPGEHGPRKITQIEAIGKSFGFQPVSSSKAWDQRQIFMDLKAFVDKRKQSFANRFMNARNEGNLAEVVKVKEEVSAWNKKWQDAGKPEYTINLGGAIRSRVKQQMPEKKFRHKAMELKEAYQ